MKDSEAPFLTYMAAGLLLLLVVPIFAYVVLHPWPSALAVVVYFCWLGSLGCIYRAIWITGTRQKGY